MRQAAQTNREVYGTNYQPSDAGVDGAGIWRKDGKLRDVPSDAFRELSIPYNPNLSQRLPAEKQYELENSSDYRALEDELASLLGKYDPESSTRKKELRQEKYRMRDSALEDWRKIQPYFQDTQPEYHRRIFDRVRFMMPERDRLASSLFQVTTLRSPIGISALHDMMALQVQKREVLFRPGLEKDKCHCIKREPNSCSESDGDGDDEAYDWKHIYDCYKKRLTLEFGFAEFCFQCHQWLVEENAWNCHCRGHLERLDNFPVCFDPLIYGGVLASPGYCPFCLRNEALPEHKRMYQFTERRGWLSHMHQHLEALRLVESNASTLSQSIQCPHPEPECPKHFSSVLKLEFHLQDIHGLDMRRRSADGVKAGGEDFRSTRKRKRRESQLKKEDYIKEISFVNSTIVSMKKRQCKEPKTFEPLSPVSDATLYYPDAEGSRCSIGSTPDTDDIVVDPALVSLFDVEGDMVDVRPTDHVETDTDFGSGMIGDPNLELQAEIHEDGQIDSYSLIEGLERIIKHDNDTNASQSVSSGQPIPTNEPPSINLPSNSTLFDKVPSSISQDDEFEVQDTLQKGRIGQRVYFKVRWKGYSPDYDSWLPKIDVGLKAIALWNSKGQQEFKFKDLVCKKTRDDGSIWYEASWHGQESSENMWVRDWELSKKVIAMYDAKQLGTVGLANNSSAICNLRTSSPDVVMLPEPPLDQLVAGANETTSSYQLHNFHNLDHQEIPPLSLSRLLTELRLQIWEYTLPKQRVIRVGECHGGFRVYGAHPPVALHVCYESREVALKRFKPTLIGEDIIPRPIFYQAQADILYLDIPGSEYSFARLYPEICQASTVALKPWVDDSGLMLSTPIRFASKLFNGERVLLVHEFDQLGGLWYDGCRMWLIPALRRAYETRQDTSRKVIELDVISESDLISTKGD
jgi:hypothetical protein